MQYPIGIDFEWYATDRADHVARFTTCGLGPIPASVLNHGGPYGALGAQIASLPPRGAADLLASFPKPDDFRRIAEAGLFAYDYRDGRYELVAKPGAPLVLNDLSGAAAASVALVRLLDISFDCERLLSEPFDGGPYIGPNTSD